MVPKCNYGCKRIDIYIYNMHRALSLIPAKGQNRDSHEKRTQNMFAFFCLFLCLPHIKYLPGFVELLLMLPAKKTAQKFCQKPNIFVNWLFRKNLINYSIEFLPQNGSHDSCAAANCTAATATWLSMARANYSDWGLSACRFVSSSALRMQKKDCFFSKENICNADNL